MNSFVARKTKVFKRLQWPDQKNLKPWHGMFWWWAMKLKFNLTTFHRKTLPYVGLTTSNNLRFTVSCGDNYCCVEWTAPCKMLFNCIWKITCVDQWEPPRLIFLIILLCLVQIAWSGLSASNHKLKHEPLNFLTFKTINFVGLNCNWKCPWIKYLISTLPFVLRLEFILHEAWVRYGMS